MLLKLVETPEEIKDWIKNFSVITKQAKVIEQWTSSTGGLIAPDLKPQIVYIYQTASIDDAKESVLLYNVTHNNFFTNAIDEIEAPLDVSSQKIFMFSSRLKREPYTLPSSSLSGSPPDVKLVEQTVH